MRPSIAVFFCASVFLTCTSNALAVAITATVSTQVGTPYNTAAMAGFATTGDDMDGMLVTTFFEGGSSQTVLWAGNGGGTGAATGTGWSLAMAGNTNNTPWILSNTSTASTIVGLTIDARPGDTVFDFTLTPEQSPGSSVGGNIVDWNSTFTPTVDGPSGLTVDGTYSDQLQVGGVFFGDLYLTLELVFGGAVGTNVTGLSAGQLLSFASDTDNVATPGDITRIPEPASLALLGIALAGLGFSRRRKLH